MMSVFQPGATADLGGPLLVVVWAILGLFVLVVVFSLSLLVHHYITERQLLAERARVQKAAEFLAPAIVAGVDLAQSVRTALRRWGIGPVGIVLRRARLAISGESERRITDALEEIGEVDHHLKEARSHAPLKRAAAMRHLGQCGGARAREALLEGTGDKEAEVRRAAREGLLNLRDDEASEAALTSYLEEAAFRLAWRKTFFARLAAVASPLLIDVVQRGDLSETDEKLALEALAEERHPAAIPLAIDRLASSKPEYRAAACRLIGKLRYERGLDHLLGQLDDSEWFVRATAARALSHIPCRQEGCTTLRTKLQDEHWWVRSNAAYALAHQGDLGTRMLCEALEGSDNFAQHAALSALSSVDLSPQRQQELSAILSRRPIPAMDEMAVELLKSNPALEVSR